MIVIADIVPYAIALLLLLEGVSEGSCYRTKRDTGCFSSQKTGKCVPESECEEISAILNGPLMTKDLRELDSRRRACELFKTNVTLYCCYNPSIRTTSSTTTTESATTTSSQPIQSTTKPTTVSERTTTAIPPLLKPTKPTNEVESKKYESFVPKTCGYHTAQDDTFGWTVLIGTGHFYRSCVGTLINNGFVLTAAHCVHAVEPHNITLFFGAITVHELPQCLEENNGCQQAVAEKLWIHEAFDPIENTFNVALIQTTLAITNAAKPYIYPICLPLNTTDEDTDQAKRHILRPRIYDATDLIGNGAQEACGYSGAPIVVIDTYKLYHVVGVANHPVDCHGKRVKRDATPLMEYVDWILNILTNGNEHVESWAAEKQPAYDPYGTLYAQ